MTDTVLLMPTPPRALDSPLAEILAHFKEAHVSGWPAFDHPAIVTGNRARQIIADVAEAHGFTSDVITGESRHLPHVVARWAAIAAVSKEFPGWSLNRLGRLFDRDHTTILSVLRKAGLRPPKRSERGAA